MKIFLCGADRISTHTLLAEGDSGVLLAFNSDFGFQPTPSSRRVTGKTSRNSRKSSISTHTLLAEGDDKYGKYVVEINPISTHTLLAEGDRFRRSISVMCGLFQPTPSSRRVTSRGHGT